MTIYAFIEMVILWFLNSLIVNMLRKQTNKQKRQNGLFGSSGDFHVALLPASFCRETRFSGTQIFSWPLRSLALSFKVPKRKAILMALSWWLPTWMKRGLMRSWYRTRYSGKVLINWGVRSLMPYPQAPSFLCDASL